MMKMPVAVIKGNTKRETGRKAQSTNIMAAKVGSNTAITEIGLHHG